MSELVGVQTVPDGGGEPTGAPVAVRAQRQVDVVCFEPPSCARCGDPLVPVVADLVGPDGLWSALQADGALELRLGGGYGMAIDPLGVPEHELTVLVCGPCLPGFAAANPWLAPLLAGAGADLRRP